MSVHSLHFRPYAGPGDLQAMIRLTERLRAAGQRVYPIAADLHEELADPETQITARLWEDGGELAGFAYVSRWQNLVKAFDEARFTPEVQAEMMAEMTAAARRRNQVKGENQTLDASVLEDDLPGAALLEGFGFIRQEESSLLYARSLEGDLPDPVLPPGFSIRPMGGADELEAYVALHRAAFGTDHMTVEYRRSIMSAPGYLPELDLVAAAPNGDLAAFCMGQIFADDASRAGGTKEGWTDPLGTHPDYRRLGLARALMLAAMRLLRVRGIDTALLGTSSTNLAMRRAAEDIGFRAVSNTLWYSRTVE